MRAIFCARVQKTSKQKAVPCGSGQPLDVLKLLIYNAFFKLRYKQIIINNADCDKIKFVIFYCYVLECVF